MKKSILMCVMSAWLMVGCGLSPRGGVGYVVQVGSFANIDNAGRFVDTLNFKGLDAFLFKENGFYKVRFGNYASLQEAKDNAQKYRDSGLIGDFFILYPKEYAINTQKGANAAREDIVLSAKQYLGVPYKWGGENEDGFDCSGFTRAVYRLNGIALPRSSIEQYKTGHYIPKESLQIGDLVFFITNNGARVNHVGIYIGNNEFIHAPSKNKVVSIARLDSNYWAKAYHGARSYL